jgi:hypothetical protein
MNGLKSSVHDLSSDFVAENEYKKLGLLSNKFTAAETVCGTH